MNQDVLNWLDGQWEAMITLLEEIVSIDSASYDKAGFDCVGVHIQGFLEQHGGVGNAPVLLMGHMNADRNTRYDDL